MRRSCTSKRLTPKSEALMVKVLQTRYKGYHFRSRLEARWAVFFDALGWEWRYEDEGFVLTNDRHYLPDFLLPQCGTYIEVKPEKPSSDEMGKLMDFVLEGARLILVIGLPALQSYERCFRMTDDNGQDWICSDAVYFVWHDMVGTFEFSGSVGIWELYPDWGGVDKAVAAARSARFEWGEEGAT